MEVNYEIYSDAWYEKQKITLALELYKCRYIHRKGVDNIIKMIDKFITEKTLKNVAYKTVKAKEKEKDLNNYMDIILYECRNPFRKLRTEKQRFTTFRKKCFYKDPFEFTVALKDNAQNLTQTHVTAVHLPLIYQLQVFFEIPGLRREVLRYNYTVNKIFEENVFASTLTMANFGRNIINRFFKEKSLFQYFCSLTTLRPAML